MPIEIARTGNSKGRSSTKYLPNAGKRHAPVTRLAYSTGTEIQAPRN